MKAAEGEVQEKGYVASFPSLINVSGEATYIMVLKDSGGLVKLYALVNVENYSIVATGSTQQEAKEEYIRLLKEEGIISSDEATPPENTVETKTADIAVENVRIATVNGESVIYINGSDGNLYKKVLSEDETLMLIAIGDKVSVKYTDSEANEKIKQLVSWSVSENS